MTQTLLQMPAAFGLYAKALGTVRRKPGKNIRLPALEVQIAAVQADTQRLAAYRDICGFEGGGDEELPITFPQVQAAPLHMWLMLQPQFPIPLMGLVHLRNRFERLGPMPAGQAYDIRVALVDGRRTHQGYEFDILTEYRGPDGELLHRALMTPLYRMRVEGLPKPPKPVPPPASIADYLSFDVPGDIGRRYAPIGGDFNPIHLSALSARAFGFPRAIAHGMWAVARAAALLEVAQGRRAANLEVQFRQPLLLPGKVALRYRAGEGDIDFALLSRTADKTHFVGRLG